ncbi:DUF397 domain-containing protein [Streptomyces sp. NBC_01205]|uniref:DUF397 domain-containing protein n=1 Tax=Streptomyces sp. NBC_01205 TaxID=2903771 RepID=UPI002E0EA8D4|nr:DUF397 domain-containing protein [Streptomyces sp. NBC_01205]
MPEGGPNWRTSSYTGTETCVEVASDTPGCVMVRDTKRRDGGTITGGAPSAWSSFVEYSRACQPQPRAGGASSRQRHGLTAGCQKPTRQQRHSYVFFRRARCRRSPWPAPFTAVSDESAAPWFHRPK